MPKTQSNLFAERMITQLISKILVLRHFYKYLIKTELVNMTTENTEIRNITRAKLR